MRFRPETGKNRLWLFFWAEERALTAEEIFFYREWARFGVVEWWSEEDERGAMGNSGLRLGV